MYWDNTYLLVILGAVICGIASLHVKSTFNRYSKVLSRRGITGAQVAARMLEEAGIYDVEIHPIVGSLTDNYSPGEKVLSLSSSVYGVSSVAAIGVAAHECGHAIQHDQGYMPLQLRSALVPVVNIGSKLSFPVLFLGLLLGSLGLARVGVFLFSFAVLFQLLTLPVEFNASHRALSILEQNGILEGNELSGARSVLRAAALTYVAALFSSLLQLLRLILLTQGNNRRRR